jgi:hypothetical protein
MIILGLPNAESFKRNQLLLKEDKAGLVENAQEMLSLLVPDQRPMKDLTSYGTSLDLREIALIAQFPVTEISFEEFVIRTQTAAPALNALLSALLLKKAYGNFRASCIKRVN